MWGCLLIGIRPIQQLSQVDGQWLVLQNVIYHQMVEYIYEQNKTIQQFVDGMIISYTSVLQVIFNYVMVAIIAQNRFCG